MMVEAELLSTDIEIRNLLQQLDQPATAQTTIAVRDLAKLHLYRVLANNAPLSILWKNAKLEYVWVNQQFIEDAGFTKPEDIIGKTDFDMPWTTQQAINYRNDDQAVIDSGQPRLNIIETITRSDGSTAWLSTNKIPIFDQDGRSLGIIGTYEDITQRTQEEITLRRYHQMVEMLFNNVPAAIFWKDKNSTYLGCNTNFARNAGLTKPEDIVGKTDFDLPWTYEQAQMYIEDDAHIIATGKPKLDFIEQQRAASGETQWLQVSKVPLYDNYNQIIGVLGTYQNITEQIEASEALRHERISALEERQRLARDLHDAVSQTLWTASIIVDTLPKVWTQDQAEGHKNLNRLSRLVQGALAEMRMLLLELRPAALVETELGDLLRQLASATMSSKPLDIDVQIGRQVQLAPDVKVNIYRIVQEALNNVIRHARATKVSITLTGDRERMILDIEDDGRGFDPAQLTPSQHMGLKIMRERAEQINAQYHLASSLGQGTHIRLIYPLGEEK